MPNTTEVDEAEIAKLVSDGGLKPETLARRKRVRAAFQAFTMEHYEKDVTERGIEQSSLCIPLNTLCQQTTIRSEDNWPKCCPSRTHWNTTRRT